MIPFKLRKYWYLGSGLVAFGMFTFLSFFKVLPLSIDKEFTEATFWLVFALANAYIANLQFDNCAKVLDEEIECAEDLLRRIRTVPLGPKAKEWLENCERGKEAKKND